MTSWTVLAAVVMVLIIIAGYAVMTHIADKKWGYTKEREQKLEQEEFLHK